MPVHAIKVDGLIPSDALGTGAPDGTKFLRDDRVWATPAGGGAGVTDGDKGDITVTGGGTVWTVDPGIYQPLSLVLTNTTASFTTAQETKLSGIAAGATVNSSDATLLNRANHTGTQAAGTITGLGSAALANTGDFAPAVHTHAAADITSGVIATARLGSGSATGATFLRGDQTWGTPSGGGGSIDDALALAALL